MNLKEAFKKLTAKHLFPTYLPHMKSTWMKKITGKNSNGNPVDFTETEKEEIREAFDKLFEDVKKDL